MISIGLPVYNDASTLIKTLKSIFAQTFEDWELILCDDGSTDGSLQLCHAIDDHRVRVISDGSNRGISQRLNQIALLAQGEWLARMDADDIMHPERLEHQIAFLTKHPDVDLLGTAIYSIDYQDQVQGIRGDRILNVMPSAVVTRGLFAHPTVMGRRKWFLRNPYCDGFRRAQDRELWCRTRSSTSAANLTKPLLYYREQDVSITKVKLQFVADRQILVRYGPTALGYGGTALHLGRSYFKELVYRTAYKLGGANYLVQRRNRRLSQTEFADARSGLNSVLAAEVPGVTFSTPATRVA